MNYNQAMDYIDGLYQYGIVPGLSSIQRLCEKMGNPQERLSFIHIAGTNGKGSVLAYVSTILNCAGYKTGRYLSPTIFEYTERIQVSGKSIPKKTLCEGLDYIKEICTKIIEEGFPHPTPFEVETALAFWYFDKVSCDVVVLETGMGGREDSTNIIQNVLIAVLTSISMDHMQFLGKNLESIAEHKAGIIKPNCSVVCMQQREEVLSVIKKIAVEHMAPLTVVEPKEAKNIQYGLTKQIFSYGDLKKIEISMAGKFQIENAMLAIKIIERLNDLDFTITEIALRKGLKETNWPGRFQVIAKKPFFIVDGAHNEEAAKKLGESIEFYFTNKRIIYIMGMLKDKEYEKIISYTHQYAEHIITVTPPDTNRGMPSFELAQEIQKNHGKVTTADSLEEAVEMSYLFAKKEDVIIAFGSLSFLGKLIKIVERYKEK